MKKIKLTQGQYALVDDEDFEYLNQWKWYLHSVGYAVRNIPSGQVYMHRLINNTPKGLLTDHINRNKLDNQRTNLRTVNKSINAVNTGLRSTNKSGCKGVSWSKLHNKWEAYIWKNSKKYHLGLFETILEADRARRIAEQRYHYGI